MAEIRVNDADLDRYLEIDGRGFVMTRDGVAQFKAVLAAAPDIAWIRLGAVEVRVTPATRIATLPYAGDGVTLTTSDLRDAERVAVLID